MVDSLPSIYALIHPDTGALRYIGKANNADKRLAGHIRASRVRKSPLYSWIRKLAREGLKPDMVILETNCADWGASERKFIASARRMGADILNIADGGNQPKCPTEVQASNGRMTVGRLNGSHHVRMLRVLGKEAKWLDTVGMGDDAAILRNTQALLRLMTKEAKAAYRVEGFA